MPNSVESQILATGNALKTFFTSRVSGLNLKTLDWLPAMVSEPSYPADPRAELPRAYFRLVAGSHLDGGNLGCGSAGYIYQLTIWLQLLQTPGEKHQELLIAGLELFQTALLSESLQLVQALEVDALSTCKVDPAQAIVFNELEHELKNPKLRVSSGQTGVQLRGDLRA